MNEQWIRADRILTAWSDIDWRADFTAHPLLEPEFLVRDSRLRRFLQMTHQRISDDERSYHREAARLVRPLTGASGEIPPCADDVLIVISGLGTTNTVTSVVVGPGTHSAGGAPKRLSDTSCAFATAGSDALWFGDGDTAANGVDDQIVSLGLDGNEVQRERSCRSANAQTTVGKAIGHQVYGMGGSRSQDDLMCLRGVEVKLNFFPCPFIGVRCFLAEGMNAPVDVRIVATVIIHN